LKPASQTLKTQGTSFSLFCNPFLLFDIQFKPVDTVKYPVVIRSDPKKQAGQFAGLTA
jgi:hypothetical protein